MRPGRGGFAGHFERHQLPGRAVGFLPGQRRPPDEVLLVQGDKEAQTRFQTDKDAFQQVLIHLLQNATAATQAEGTITLHIRMQDDENKNHFISVQVSDTGGGISAEDMPRVDDVARRAAAATRFAAGVFEVGPDVLIPRPETELLAEYAIEAARAVTPRRVVVDLGTGSGAIALLQLVIGIPPAVAA